MTTTDWLNWSGRPTLWLAVNWTLLRLWWWRGHWTNCSSSWIVLTTLHSTCWTGSSRTSYLTDWFSLAATMISKCNNTTIQHICLARNHVSFHLQKVLTLLLCQGSCSSTGSAGRLCIGRLLVWSLAVSGCMPTILEQDTNTNLHSDASI